MQTSLVTHEIHHIEGLIQQSEPEHQQDQASCTLCVSFVHLVGIITYGMTWQLLLLTTNALLNACSMPTPLQPYAVYAARGPPYDCLA